MKNIKKSELSTPSKTGELAKPFIRPKRVLQQAIFLIVWGFFLGWMQIMHNSVVLGNILLLFVLIEGCLLIFRAKLGNQQVLAHQIIIVIGDSFMFFMGFLYSIIFWATAYFLNMVGGITIILVSTLVSIIHCLYWCVKLEKYKLKN